MINYGRRSLLEKENKQKKRLTSVRTRFLQGLILALGLLNTFTNNLEKGRTQSNIRGFRESTTFS